jgi:hypothetical protein
MNILVLFLLALSDKHECVSLLLFLVQYQYNDVKSAVWFGLV